jgi:hypothetical protein
MRLIPISPRISVAQGVPDGLFSNKKYQFGYILEGYKLENVEKCYGYLEYFTGF